MKIFFFISRPRFSLFHTHFPAAQKVVFYARSASSISNTFVDLLDYIDTNLILCIYKKK